jgi:DNA polymerase-3 subunit gamma/tau
MTVTLYRQYRPQRFADLYGQDAARTILQNALARERLAHAYLFSGSRGTGKTTTARIVARAATCEKPVVKKEKGHAVYEPCNTCASCTAQLADHAPDIVEIDAASNRGIEDIRQLREQAHYLPLSLKRKVYIIDEVHMLTTDAFNALLKTLEEPPKHCLFILATTELHKVPATIRSRCQIIRFERGSEAAIVQKLAHIVKTEEWSVEAGVTELIARHAHGAFRDAETILDQLATRFQPLTLASCIEALGITDDEVLRNLLDALLTGDLLLTRDLLQAIEVHDQHRCELLFTELIEGVRTELVKPGHSSEALLPLTRALTLLLEGFVLIKGSPHPKLVLETSCYEVAALSQRGIKAEVPAAPPTEPTATPERVAIPPAKTIAIKPEPNKAQPTAPVVELRDAAIKDVRQAWKEMIRVVGRDSAPLAQMLREAVIFSTDNNVLTVHVKYKFHVEKLGEKKNHHRVETLLHQITHEKWLIEYHLKDTLPRHEVKKAVGSGASEAAAAVFG